MSCIEHKKARWARVHQPSKLEVFPIHRTIYERHKIWESMSDGRGQRLQALRLNFDGNVVVLHLGAKSYLAWGRGSVLLPPHPYATYLDSQFALRISSAALRLPSLILRANCPIHENKLSAKLSRSDQNMRLVSNIIRCASCTRGYVTDVGPSIHPWG